MSLSEALFLKPNMFFTCLQKFEGKRGRREKPKKRGGKKNRNRNEGKRGLN